MRSAFAHPSSDIFGLVVSANFVLVRRNSTVAPYAVGSWFRTKVLSWCCRFYGSQKGLESVLSCPLLGQIISSSFCSVTSTRLWAINFSLRSTLCRILTWNCDGKSKFCKDLSRRHRGPYSEAITTDRYRHLFCQYSHHVPLSLRCVDYPSIFFALLTLLVASIVAQCPWSITW